MEQREDVCVGRIITKGDVHDEGEEERERESGGIVCSIIAAANNIR